MNNPNPATATKLIAEGGSRPVVSDDGRYVGYNTLNLTGIFAKDMQTGRTLVVTPSAGSAGSDPDTFRPEISGDGKFLIFASDLQLAPNDTNNARDVYVADLRPWEAGSDAPPPLKVVSVGLNGQAAGLRQPPGHQQGRLGARLPELGVQPRQRRHERPARRLRAGLPRRTRPASTTS